MSRVCALCLVLCFCLSTVALAFDTPDGPSGRSAYLASEHPKAHGVLTDQAIAILRNDGFGAAADACQANRQALYDGLRAADLGGGRIILDVPVLDELPRFLGGPALEWNLAKNAFSHFYDSSLPESHRGYCFGLPHIPWIAPDEWYILNGPHPSAADMADWHYAKAVEAMRDGRVYEAYFNLGWVIHLVQDLFVPHDAVNTVVNNHQEYEDWVDTVVGEYLVAGGGTYNLHWLASDFVKEAAALSRPHFGSARSSSGCREAAAATLPAAQRYTAGVLRKFHDRWPTEPYTAVLVSITRVADNSDWTHFWDFGSGPDFSARLAKLAGATLAEPPVRRGSYTFKRAWRTGYVADDWEFRPTSPVPAWVFPVYWARAAESPYPKGV